MKLVSAAEIDAALDFTSLIDALGDAFAHPPVQPVRHHHTIETGNAGGSTNTLLLMPAWQNLTGKTVAQREDAMLGVKIVAVAPENGARGLPAVNGTYLLCRALTGEVLAAMDGQRITLWRTAAASALAARYLARPDTSTMAMLGAGALAPFLVRAHASVRPIKTVLIWNRSLAPAEALAETLSKDGFSCRVVGDPDEAVRIADLISAATLSQKPLIKGALLKPGTHLDLVGAFTPDMREADVDAVARSEVHVDTRAGALKEGGDLVQALKAGALSAEQVLSELTELVTDKKSGRTNNHAITLFKSVGAALEDLAAANLVWSRLA
jgi:ornithine cyclodeaminase/alanine dehydrogenase-like protein (mu-crystallin family)